MNTTHLSAILVGVAVLTACANHSSEPTRDEVLAVMKTSFAEKGQAKLDRLDQTPLQAACSAAAEQGKTLDEKMAEAMQKASYDKTPYPADGQYLGDWKEGEKIAQSGRGFQFSDALGSVAGGNCYACHQLASSELSYGNFGPSLNKYAVLRGVKDPKAKGSEAIVKYTWAKIWNSNALHACSNMPRFGDAGILTEKQIKDVMALLLDPNSPVNK
jgi:sulfur-oxidizing protein SoxX